MRTQLKSTLALVLALLICVSVFAACKGKTGTDADSSSTPLLSFADVPSQAEVDIDAGTITMAYGKTFADLKTDLIAEGKLLEDQGETLHLYKEDKVTEITDETTPLENGMVAIKRDAQCIFQLLRRDIGKAKGCIVRHQLVFIRRTDHHFAAFNQSDDLAADLDPFIGQLQSIAHRVSVLVSKLI